MTSTSKNVYIDKLDDIGNKCKNLYHSTIKMKSVGVKSNAYIDSSEEINNKDPKFKISDIVRIYQHIKIFLQKVTLQVVQKRFLWFKKLKILCSGLMLLTILIEKKLLKHFMKKNWKSRSKRG